MDENDDKNINDLNLPINESEDLINGTEEWLDKHGRPSFAYLQSLVEDGNPQAVETLMAIADQYNLTYSPEIDLNELVDMIRLAIVQE